MKKLLSLLLAAILAFSLALPAFAADPASGQYKVTSTPTRRVTFRQGSLSLKPERKLPLIMR